MTKQIFFLLFLFGATVTMCAQPVVVQNRLIRSTVDTAIFVFSDLKYHTKVPEHAISFNADCGVPFMHNALTKSDFWNKKAGIALSFGIDYRYQFQKTVYEGNVEIKQPTLLGIGIGLGISYFTQKAFMDNHTEQLRNITDIDGDVCNVTLSYSGIKEKVALTYLDIPLYLEIGKPSRVKISGYFDVGVKASLLLSGKFSGEGAYSSSGYYRNIGRTPAEVTLENIDVLGYYTDKASYENPAYKLSRFVLWGSVSGGISIPFSNLETNHLSHWILRIGAKIDYTLMPVAKKTAASGFSEAAYRINQSNLLDGSRIFMLGLDIKFIYCL